MLRRDGHSLMAITVRFFAALRERLGRETLDIPASSSVDMKKLLDLIQRQLGEGAIEVLSAPNVRIALNKEFATDHCLVHDGDEVAFMPPITGG